MTLTAALIGWALIVRDPHEGLWPDARREAMARAARADRPASRRRISLRRDSLRRVIARRTGAATKEGIA